MAVLGKKTQASKTLDLEESRAQGSILQGGEVHGTRALTKRF